MTSPDRAALADELEAMRALVRGYEVLARDSLGAGLRAEYALVAKALTLASARSPYPYSGAAGEAVAWSRRPEVFPADPSQACTSVMRSRSDIYRYPLYAHPTLPRDGERET